MDEPEGRVKVTDEPSASVSVCVIKDGAADAVSGETDVCADVTRLSLASVDGTAAELC